MVQPINEKELHSLIKLALQKQPVVGESTLLNPMNRIGVEFHGIYGVSVPMQHVVHQIKEASMTDISILITGETGTGKDLVAAAIHKCSQLKEKPYVVVHTGAMPVDLIASELFGYESGAFTGATESTQGKFEQADGGTIFLDEIGTMDHKVQISLLRILEKNSFQRLGGKKKINVDVRIIAATNENLPQLVKDKKFRELAKSRVNKAIKAIQLIGNLANKSHYTYSDNESDQIINALEKELKTTKQKFKNSNNGRRRDAFDFE